MTSQNNGINVLKLIKQGHSFSSIAKLMHQKENNVPAKQQLLNAFQKEMSFKYVTSVFQVDTKTLKKWMKHYNLPVTLKELKNIL